VLSDLVVLHDLFISEKSPKEALRYSTISGLNGKTKSFLSIEVILPSLTLSFQVLNACKESEQSFCLEGICFEGIIPSTAASASVRFSLFSIITPLPLP